MKTLVIQNGTTSDAMLTNSLLTRMVRDGDAVHCITSQNAGEIFSLIKGVKVSFLPEIDISEQYDMAVNLYPEPRSGMIMNRVHAHVKRGYGFDGEHIVFLDKSSDLHYRITRFGIYSNSSLFQLVYGMAGLTWKGEGYNLQYTPRNRQRKSLTGLCIKDLDLRNFILQHLLVKEMRTIPIRQSVAKQIDEINRCKNLVTDDEGCMHVGLSLKKHVEYVSKRPTSYGLEMFKNGNIHVFNPEALRGK